MRMITNFQLILLITTLLSIISCSSSSNYEYEILKEDFDKVYNKSSVYVQLPNPIEKNELTNIAKEIRASRKKFDILFVFYSLPNMKIGERSWAITHFEPEMKLKILGSTVNETTTMNSQKVTGEILGKWKDKAFMIESVKYLVKEDDNLKIKTVFGDGSIGEITLKESKKNNLIRYDFENKNNQFYIIEENGNLGFYGEEGKISEGKKLK